MGREKSLILSHDDIRSEIELGGIGLNPMDDGLARSNSYVLRLGGNFRTLESGVFIDTAAAQNDL